MPEKFQMNPNTVMYFLSLNIWFHFTLRKLMFLSNNIITLKLIREAENKHNKNKWRGIFWKLITSQRSQNISQNCQWTSCNYIKHFLPLTYEHHFWQRRRDYTVEKKAASSISGAGNRIAMCKRMTLEHFSIIHKNKTQNGPKT